MIRIIPAIDIIDGKCVRLTYGDFAKKTIYNDKPWEVAKRFEDAGLRRLHLVDLDGARLGKVVNFKVLEKISATTTLKIDFGGGIKTDEDIQIAFNSGTSIISTGSIALKNRLLLAEWLEKYGSEKIIVATDVRDDKIAVSGWQENSGVSVYTCIKEITDLGVKQIICTDISKDGTLEGPSLQLYKGILNKIKGFKLIASGGISCIQDIEEVSRIGCAEVIIGKALYEGRIQLDELKPYIE